LYEERDELKRSEFSAKITLEDFNKIVFADESELKNSMTNEYGWSFRGTSVCGEKKGRATEKLNIIAGMMQNKIVSPMIYNCNTDASFFNAWLERHLIPELIEKSVIVLDNASFHNTKKTKEIVEQYGYKILFLPPYSPDLNPIEKFWAVLKNKN
jgi:transposase